ncbi:hypothetical protein BC832DRAFT_560729 [Gaertneriomyces semiglobifer]|nr:hypothetical protein BC832DRAFT_560729 [Gaertneriomyces semiglobifer]
MPLLGVASKVSTTVQRMEDGWHTSYSVQLYGYYSWFMCSSTLRILSAMERYSINLLMSGIHSLARSTELDSARHCAIRLGNARFPSIHAASHDSCTCCFTGSIMSSTLARNGRARARQGSPCISISPFPFTLNENSSSSDLDGLSASGPSSENANKSFRTRHASLHCEGVMAWSFFGCMSCPPILSCSLSRSLSVRPFSSSLRSNTTDVMFPKSPYYILPFMLGFRTGTCCPQSRLLKAKSITKIKLRFLAG